MNVPAIRYSRDEMAVVSGATGSWVSLLPDTSRRQPSGVSRIPGGPEGTSALGWDGIAQDSPEAAGRRRRWRLCSCERCDRYRRGAQAASMAKRFNMVGLTPLSSEPQGPNGSVAREPLRVRSPNDERRDNGRHRVAIQLPFGGYIGTLS